MENLELEAISAMPSVEDSVMSEQKRLLSIMSGVPTGGEAYESCLDDLVRLQDISKSIASAKTESKKLEKAKEIDPNVVISGCFSVAALLLIMRHELASVITTKALPLATKMLPKVV